MLETVRPVRRRLSTMRVPQHSSNSRRLRSILSSSDTCPMLLALRSRFRVVVLQAWAEATSKPSLAEQITLVELSGGYLSRDGWSSGKRAS